MALPKLTVMKHELALPSTGEKVTFRPFLVKEEKILMMAMQSGKPADMINGLKHIITNCVETDINIEELAPFDLEYIFLQLRARSVGDVISVSYSVPEEKCCLSFKTSVKITRSRIMKCLVVHVFIILLPS